MATAAGPRAKRPRIPREVATKDSDGPGDFTEMSQLVRDLCRQWTFDRTAWKDMVAAFDDHARRLDQLEHESLQVNDDVARLLDGQLQALQGQEQRHRDYVTAAVADVTAGVRVVEQNLRGHVDDGLKNSKVLLAELKAKFEQLDGSVAALVKAAQGAPVAQPQAGPQRAPLIDPTTGWYQGYMSEPGPKPAGAAEPAGPTYCNIGTPLKATSQTFTPCGAPPQGPAPVPGFDGVDGHAHAASGTDYVPRFPVPGMGLGGAAAGGTGPTGAPPAAAVPQPRGPSGWPMAVGAEQKLACDSKTFETKVAQDSRNQFDGGKTGAHWKTITRGYFMSRCPMTKFLLRWAEDFKKNTILPEHVFALKPFMDEDPMVIDHLLWAYFNLNLTGQAREIFCNVGDFQGLEVWRRVSMKINDKGEG